MKKHNPLVILILIAGNLAAGYISGYIIHLIMGDKGFNWESIITTYCFLFLFLGQVNTVVFPLARRTMEKYLKANNFGRTTTFITTDDLTLRKMLCVDEDNGRIAYVSVTNPLKVQTAKAGELKKIRASYVIAPFKATRYVFFEFYHGNTRFRFPTLRTKNSWFLFDSGVQAALASANEMRDLLLKFNPEGSDFSVNFNIPYSKKALAGFLFAFFSIYATVAAVITDIHISSVLGLGPFENGSIPAYGVTLLGIALAVTGLVLGITVFVEASRTPLRGLGQAKAAVIMSSIVLAILLLALVLFITG